MQVNKLNVLYLWLLIPISPFVAYVLLDKPSYSTNLFQYICSIITLVYLIICYLKHLEFPKITKASFIIISIGFLILDIGFSSSSLYAFAINAFDFSTFKSLIEMSLAGKLGYSEPLGVYHFGYHTNWILIPIGIIYHYLTSPLTLLITGDIALWLPGVLIFYYCQKHLKFNSFIALIFSLVFWTNYYSFIILKAYFFPEDLYISAFLLLLLTRKNEALLPLLLASILFVSIKEDFIIYLAPWCLYNLGIKKDKRFAYILILCIAMFILNYFIVQPYFLAKSQLIYPVQYQYWIHWGRTPKEIMYNILTHPIDSLIYILKAHGWKRLYGALLFIPWLSLDMLSFSIVPILIYSLTGYNNAMSQFHNYYSILLWPAALVGYIQVMAKINNSELTYKRLIETILLIVLIISCLWSNNGLPLYQVNKTSYASFLQLKASLLANNSYCIQENIYPHLDDSQYKLYTLSRLRLHQDCYPVLASLGNQYPYNNLPLLKNTIEVLKDNKCIVNNLTPFYVVDKSQACHKIILDKLNLN